MKFKELLKLCRPNFYELKDMNDKMMDELMSIYPHKFIVSSLKMNLWEVEFDYVTVRGNRKTNAKYLITQNFDKGQAIENFNEWVKKYNTDNPMRKLNNTVVSNIKYIGEMELPIE